MTTRSALGIASFLLAVGPSAAQTACEPTLPFAGMRCEIGITFEEPVSVEEALDLACRHGLQIRYTRTTFPAPPDGLPTHATNRVRPGQSADSLRKEWTTTFITSKSHIDPASIERMRTPNPRMDAATQASFQRMADHQEAQAAWARSLDPDSLARTLTIEGLDGVVFGKSGLVRELGDAAVNGLCLPWLNVWPFSAAEAHQR